MKKKKIKIKQNSFFQSIIAKKITTQFFSDLHHQSNIPHSEDHPPTMNHGLKAIYEMISEILLHLFSHDIIHSKSVTNVVSTAT
ncbi:hypothetical protein I7I48_10629 [Histoplasma ohiense]|nr:hypothetical protein I7I48_10629 [Histoplasma ohiense (nom. inval.)]